MGPDFFHASNLRLFSRLLRRTEEAVMEVVTDNETKFLIEFLHPHKVWKVEEISSEGYVHVDFQPKLSRCIDNISHVEQVIVRRKSLEEHR